MVGVRVLLGGLGGGLRGLTAVLNLQTPRDSCSALPTHNQRGLTCAPRCCFARLPWSGLLSGLEELSAVLEAPLEDILALVTHQPTLLLAKV